MLCLLGLITYSNAHNNYILPLLVNTANQNDGTNTCVTITMKFRFKSLRMRLRFS